MIAFSDFQCPFCGRFAREVLPQIERDFIVPGHVQFVHRHLPLNIHPHAIMAAESAECAAEQALFWPFHDRLFDEKVQLDDESIRVIASSINIDLRSFDECLNRESTRNKVAGDSAEAQRLGVVSTPSFLLGFRHTDSKVQILRAFSGARSFEQFRAELQQAVDRTSLNSN
jgi:protein-disulfide isomerase